LASRSSRSCRRRKLPIPTAKLFGNITSPSRYFTAEEEVWRHECYRSQTAKEPTCHLSKVVLDNNSETGIPLSACFKIAMIWLSVNRDFFIESSYPQFIAFFYFWERWFFERDYRISYYVSDIFNNSYMIITM